MEIICISGKAQHGKDTAAKMLSEELEKAGKKVLLTHYADLLKWMCKTYFSWDGEKDSVGRTLLQRVGTDVVRKKFPNFWVDWIIQIINLFPDEWDFLIIPDCRFPNEVAAMRNAANTLDTKSSARHIRIVRNDFESSLSAEQKAHISETALDSYPYDNLLRNSTLLELKKQIIDILETEYKIKIAE